MKEIENLADRWIEEAETLDRYRDERGASLCRMHAGELKAALDSHESELLSLSQASGESGYSPDHLRHLIKEGTIPNAGRKGSPRIRRGDLPVKPGAQPSTGLDTDEVAREIAGRIQGRAA